MFDIRNDTDPDTNLFALAADYRLVDFTSELELARFDPVTVRLLFDYVRNVGFDEDQVAARTGTFVEARRDGYLLGLAVGSANMVKAHDWRVFGNYRHLERDAVVDAFSDSDFHLGGTDAGLHPRRRLWHLTVRGCAGLAVLRRDRRAATRHRSLQLDVNARF
jgi:hypothetical protein